MKNTFILFCISIVLFSCTNSADKDINKDPIIDQWQLSQITVNDNDVTNDCNTRAIINFNSDGTLFAEFFRFFKRELYIRW